MSHVIRIFRDALGRPTEHDDRFVVESYPDAFSGRGDLVTTPNLSEARRFESIQDVREFWMMASTVRPTRRDGKPNRPMTAYNIVVETVEDTESEEAR